MRSIRIEPYGNLGNQMFQYLLALAFAARVPAVIRGHRMADWDLEDGEPPRRPNRVWVGVRRHQIPFDQIVELLRADRRVDLLITGVSCRIEYWEDQLAEARRVFPPDGTVTGGGERELVINIRGNEILHGAHANYVPLPLSLYDELLASSGLEPVFVGQLGGNPYVDELRRRHPGARFLTHDDPLGDFQFVRASVNVVPAVSTYSWLAAWLSETACAVYLPVAGLFHPEARADVDLLPVGDPRYRMVQTRLHSWQGTEAELERLVTGDAAEFGFGI